MEEETVILYCLTHAHLDDIEVERLADFEESLYLDMKTSEIGKEIKAEIGKTKALPDTAKLDNYIIEFKKRFI
jgi:F0F1-type ATP synthase alpha subunit